MERLWTESSYSSLNKYGEQLCGDRVEIMHDDKSDSTTLVLADGLGSGVKANILSTLTSKILCTMIASGLSVDSCVETIASTLPVCQVRNVAYSTFSILHVQEENRAKVIQYDNPQVILLRRGKNVVYPMESREIDDKVIHESRFPLERDDVLIAMSDGAVYAGVGHGFNFGWQRENIIDFMQKNYRPEYTAKQMSTLLTQACHDLYGAKPGDDTTVAVIKMRKRYPVSLLIGPPKDAADDPVMMEQFMSGPGIKIVCGGTTAKIASNYLGKPLRASLDYISEKIPPISHIEGIDLVTEGVVTMSRVLEMALESVADLETAEVPEFDEQDGASLIAREILQKATDIRFFVGRAINPAHQDTDLSINFSIKLSLIKELTTCLKALGKEVTTIYY